MAGVMRSGVRVVRYIWHHPANRDHKVRALVGAARFQVRKRLGRELGYATLGTHMRIAVERNSTSAAMVVYANPPDWLTMQTWRRLLGPGDLFIDVGSNIGVYALWAADCGAEVVAVEPDPDNARRARSNFELNGLDAQVVECAIGREDGVMHLSSGLDTMNHLVTEGLTHAREVPVTTLDALLAGRQARGVKVDVEGAERLVLQGARESLHQQRIDVLQLEWNMLSHSTLGESRAPAQKILEDSGYVLCRPTSDFRLEICRGEVAESVSDLFAVAPQAWERLGF